MKTYTEDFFPFFPFLFLQNIYQMRISLNSTANFWSKIQDKARHFPLILVIMSFRELFWRPYLAFINKIKRCKLSSITNTRSSKKSLLPTVSNLITNSRITICILNIFHKYMTTELQLKFQPFLLNFMKDFLRYTSLLHASAQMNDE